MPPLGGEALKKAILRKLLLLHDIYLCRQWYCYMLKSEQRKVLFLLTVGIGCSGMLVHIAPEYTEKEKRYRTLIKSIL